MNEIQILCDFISCEIFKNDKIEKLINDYRDILSGNSNLEIYNYFKEEKIRFQDHILKKIIWKFSYFISFRINI